MVNGLDAGSWEGLDAQRKEWFYKRITDAYPALATSETMYSNLELMYYRMLNSGELTAGGGSSGDTLPIGGADGTVLTKQSATTGDYNWEAIPPSGASLPVGGSSGQVLTKNSGTDGDASWISPTSNSGMIFYDGTNWQARGAFAYPRMYVSTNYVSAPQPTDMVPGDMWIRHPDSFG